MSNRNGGRPLIDRPARVVHVIPTVENGGAEQQLLALSRAMDRTQWDSSVVCTHGLGSLASEYSKADVDVTVVGKRSRGDISLPWRLARRIRELEPDIVHAWLLQGNIWARLATSLLSPPPILIAAERTTDLETSPLLRFVDASLSRIGDSVVGNSNAVSTHVNVAKRVSADRVTTIWNGTDLSRAQKHLQWSQADRAAYRATRNIPHDAFLIAHIAQPIPCKRFDILAEVVGSVVRMGINAHILQLGRDPNSPDEQAYLDAFRTWINARGIAERVHRTGFVRNVSQELAIADVVLHTSDIEGFPNAIIETLAMERPVVATAAGGTAEVLHHRETGWLTETGDTEGLLRGLLHAYHDPDEVARWARAGRLLVERDYSVDSLVRNTTALYRTLMRQRGYEVPSD